MPEALAKLRQLMPRFFNNATSISFGVSGIIISLPSNAIAILIIAYGDELFFLFLDNYLDNKKQAVTLT